MALVSVELFQALRHAGLSDGAALDIAEQFTPNLSYSKLKRQLRALKALAAMSAALTLVLVIRTNWH